MIDRFSEKYRDGVVVACGGDGTAHSIGNLMIDTALTFAILPLGTGNDLYTGLYGNRSVKDQIDHIFKGKTNETDAIYIPELDLHTMNILSVGADANVVFQANDFKEKHKFLQKYAYMASILKALQARYGIRYWPNSQKRWGRVEADGWAIYSGRIMQWGYVWWRF